MKGSTYLKSFDSLQLYQIDFQSQWCHVCFDQLPTPERIHVHITGGSNIMSFKMQFLKAPITDFSISLGDHKGIALLTYKCYRIQIESKTMHMMFSYDFESLQDS